MIQNTNWSSSSIPIENREVYEFVTVPSYVALVSGDSKELLCIVNVEEKGIAGKEETESEDIPSLTPGNAKITRLS